MITNKLDGIGIRVPGALRRMLGLAPEHQYPAQRFAGPETSAGLELYEQLKAEFAAIARFPQATGTFGVRMEQLIEIDRSIEALCEELFLAPTPDGIPLAEQSPMLRASMGGRLAQLHTRLALAYRDMLEEGHRKYPAGSRGEARLQIMACRGLMAIGRAMKWHYFGSKPEPEVLWGRMYRLYRFMEKRELLRLPVELEKGVQTTFYREFVRNLLFGMSEPDDATPMMIEAAYHLCGEWTDLLDLQPADVATSAQHCIDLQGSVAPSQFHPQMSAERIRCFSTASVCFKVASLREAMHRRQLSEQSAVADGQLSPRDHELLVRQLMRGWAKARPARRDARENLGPTVARLACGVSAITELLQIHAHPDSGVEELAFENWAVENQSSLGYGLRKRKVSEEPEPGKLVCLRANGSPIWQLGVVRWDRNGETGEPQLGVETLADNPRIVKLAAGPGEKSRPLSAGAHAALNNKSGNQTPVSTNADDPEDFGVMQALLLPRDKGRGFSNTLILPERVYPVGAVLKISSDRADFWIRLSGVMDYNDHWARMTFSVMGRA